MTGSPDYTPPRAAAVAADRPAAGAPAHVHAYFRQRERWSWLAAAFWLALAACYFLVPGYLMLITQILSSALFALSLHLILGLGGMVSLGHAAFFGTGAYAAALAAQHGFDEPLLGLLLAATAAGLLGALSSVVVARLRGVALLMVTMGIGLLLHEVAHKARSITGGDDGLGIVLGPLLGLFEFDLWGRTGFLYTLVVVFLCFLVARRLTNSPYGLALAGLRENIHRMPAIGGSVPMLSARIYIIAAVMAGIAGALLTQSTQFVAVDVLSFQRSAEVLVMLALGGVGYLYGGIVGAALFMLMREVFSAASPAYWFFWIGLLLIVVVLFAQDGVLGAVERWSRRLRRWRAGR